MEDRNVEAYTRELDEQIDRWSQEMDHLQARAGDQTEDARMRYERRMGELEEKRQGARARVDALRSAADSAGDELRDGARAAVDELGSALERARAELGESQRGGSEIR
jgi:hypothetical protein